MFSAAIKTAAASGGYQISRSLRFNSADSAYLARTFPSAGNQKTWTWSAWLKLSAFGSLSTFFERRTGLSDATIMSLLIGDGSFGTTKDALVVARYSFYNLITTQVFRDPSAWYHIVLNVDTTQATSSNRMKLYVNGQQITAFSSSTYPSLNEDLPINAAAAHDIGRANFFNGYMTEVNFIDGQALTPSSFGQTNAQTGVWEPVAYSGSYGTNGFYLNFSDNSNTTAATLGKDYSGNGNNWTPNNFSVTAGAGNDSMVDTPTPYGVDTGAGGEVRGNYATLNSLGVTGVYGTYTNGNLDWQSANTDQRAGVSTFPANTGGSDMWYCEVTIGSKTSSYYTVGVFGNTNNCYSTGPNVYWRQDGPLTVNGSQVATGQTYTQGDVIGLAYDNSAGQMRFYKNGSLVSSYTQNFTSTSRFFFGCGSDSSGSTANYSWNFGQRPFAYTAPSGFKALCTQNLPTPAIGATTATQAGKFFNPVLWTANGGVQTITGVGFSPEFLWIKDRQNANSHTLHNIVVGSTRYLESNTTNAETLSANYVTSIDSDGWSMGSVNYSTGRQLVSWCWRANGSGVTNTAGSITSTVSANTTSGFSIVNWTQPGSGTYTIGHGLGVVPAMIIMKGMTNAGNWAVYHQSLGATQYLILNGTNSAATDSNVWVAAPTSTVFSQLVNYGTSGTSIAYCFAEVPGYSRFGSYTGNGSTDGPFVFCGFRPALIIAKQSSGAGENWYIIDNKRGTYNIIDKLLNPNTSAAEETYPQVDFLSNGFKIRNTGTGMNANGATMIYAAFAESPFKFALAR